MSNVWVLVTDAAHARLVELSHDAPTWRVAGTFDHPDSRKKTSELETDHVGQRTAEGRSAHHNALAPASFRHDVEKEHFAHALATTLDEALRAKRFEHLVLVAEPHFLGLLKRELSLELQKRLLASVDKDLTHLSVSDLSIALRRFVLVPADQRRAIREMKINPH